MKKLKRVITMLLTCAMILGVMTVGFTGASAATAASETLARPSTNGALSVSGTQLVDSSGNPVQLRGVSTHGLAWYPEYVNQDCFNELADWGANVIRLAMYTSDYNGYCTGGDQTWLKNLIRQGVQYATNADMYVIVDWHILNDNSPTIYQSQAETFFREMSSEFKNYNNVIYEICNEPNSGTSWSTIKGYAEDIIPIIRSNSPNSVIVVGTPTWSQDVDTAASSPITGYKNIMYSLHFYAATHKDDIRNKMTTAYNAGLPIFCTEFGICDSSGSGSIDTASANTWINMMNQYGISYVMWNLSNKDESSAMIKSSVTKTSGFSYNDLSTAGQWYYNVLTTARDNAVTNTFEKPAASGDVVYMTYNGETAWWYVTDGVVRTDYNGVANHANSNGWWYIKNGKVDFSYTGFAQNYYGWWYVESGKVTFGANSVIEGTVNGSSGWYETIGSKVQTGHTGVSNVSNPYGWWYVRNGKVDFSCNSVEQNNYGWWYVNGGQVNFGYTGVANYGNSYGWWYIKDGKVDFSKNSVESNNWGWWYVVGGKVQFGYTGVANYANAWGWWYINNGQVDFGHTGVDQNNFGWWRVSGGKVDFSFRGLASNSNGTWYLNGGKVDFGYNGTYDGRTIRNGKAV